MPGRLVDLGRVVDAHHLIHRRVQDQQGTIQLRQHREHVRCIQVFQKLALDSKRPAGQCHRCLAALFNLLTGIAQQVADMRRVKWRSDGRHRLHPGKMTGCLEAGRATERVPDEDFRRSVMRLQISGGGDQVGHVAGEGRIREIAFTVSQAGKIKPEHGDALARQGLADGRHGLGVFAASEAMGKECIGFRDPPQRQIQTSGKRLAVGILKTECLDVHFFSNMA